MKHLRVQGHVKQRCPENAPGNINGVHTWPVPSQTGPESSFWMGGRN